MKDENWDGAFVDLMEQDVENRSHIRVVPQIVSQTPDPEVHVSVPLYLW